MGRHANPRPVLSRRSDSGVWRVRFRGREIANWPAETQPDEAERRYADILKRHAEKPDQWRVRLGRQTLSGLIEEFLGSDESPRSDRQRDKYVELGALWKEAFLQEPPDAWNYGADDHRSFKVWLMAQRDGDRSRWARSTINSILTQVKRVLRFGKTRGLVSRENQADVLDVPGVRIGDGREDPPVEPADAATVRKVLPLLAPSVRALATLQLHSGARAGELVILRPVDVACRGKVWLYTPSSHKSAWRGKSRTIHFGASCQRVLRPLMTGLDPEACVFSPARSEADRNAAKSAGRVTPLWPSHEAYREKRRAAAAEKSRARAPRDRYTTGSYRRALERGCDAAGVERFTPHRLRHLALTRIREKFGIDAARAVGGHSLASVTELYSRSVDAGLSRKVAAKMG